MRHDLTHASRYHTRRAPRRPTLVRLVAPVRYGRRTGPARYRPWLDSIERVRASRPARVFCTRYGFFDDPVEHFAQLESGLHDWTSSAKRLLEQELTDEVRADRFHAEVMRWLVGKGSPEQIESYAAFADFRASWYGMARYWRKREG